MTVATEIRLTRILRLINCISVVRGFLFYLPQRIPMVFWWSAPTKSLEAPESQLELKYLMAIQGIPLQIYFILLFRPWLGVGLYSRVLLNRYSHFF